MDLSKLIENIKPTPPRLGGVQIWLPVELHRQFKSYCKERGFTMAKVTRALVQGLLDEQEVEKAFKKPQLPITKRDVKRGRKVAKKHGLERRVT